MAVRQAGDRAAGDTALLCLRCVARQCVGRAQMLDKRHSTALIREPMCQGIQFDSAARRVWRDGVERHLHAQGLRSPDGPDRATAGRRFEGRHPCAAMARYIGIGGHVAQPDVRAPASARRRNRRPALLPHRPRLRIRVRRSGRTAAGCPVSGTSGSWLAGQPDGPRESVRWRQSARPRSRRCHRHAITHRLSPSRHHSIRGRSLAGRPWQQERHLRRRRPRYHSQCDSPTAIACGWALCCSPSSFSAPTARPAPNRCPARCPAVDAIRPQPSDRGT